MNKYQEAFMLMGKKTLTHCPGYMITGNRCSCNEQSECGYKQAVDTLQELVEKATPKKPSFDKSWEDEETTDIYNEDGSINEIICLCPNCHKHGIYDSEYGVRFDYCHECGQALDWSDGDSKEWISFTFDEDGMLNCPLPDEEEEILVSDGKDVWIDTLMEDNGYYLDSGREFRGLAWMQLPKPHVKED